MQHKIQQFTCRDMSVLQLTNYRLKLNSSHPHCINLMSKAKQGKLHHLLSGKDDKLLWLSHQVGAPPKQAQVVSAFDFIIQFNYLTFSSIQWHCIHCLFVCSRVSWITNCYLVKKENGKKKVLIHRFQQTAWNKQTKNTRKQPSLKSVVLHYHIFGNMLFQASIKGIGKCGVTLTKWFHLEKSLPLLAAGEQ